MRVSKSVFAALALVIAALSTDARHLRHGGHEPSDIRLTVNHTDHQWESVEATSSAAPIDTELRSKLRNTQEAVQAEAISVVKSVPESSEVATKSPRRGNGTCIGPLCGISLFFALVWVTFAVCVAVVYVVDQQFNPWKEAEGSAGDADKPRQRRMSGGVDVARQATAYYQNVAASMNSTLMRRRPLS